jgi:hypothetical protein
MTENKHEGHAHHGEHDHVHSHLKVAPETGVVTAEANKIDDALVISGALSVMTADTEGLRNRLKEGLEKTAAWVASEGGIVGHIKASFSATLTAMLSVTETSATVKYPPEQKADITIAAIVFLVEEERVLRSVKELLESLRR